MKTFWRILPILICSLLMAAHLGRANMLILQIASLSIPFILIWKNKISARVAQLLLVVYGFEWIRILICYTQARMENDEDWIRLAIILGAVAIVNFASALVFRSKHMKKKYGLE